MKKILVPIIGLLISIPGLYANAPTREEKDLIRLAQDRRFVGIQDVIDDVKDGWKIIEYFLKDVRLNKRVHQALSDTWQRAYSYSDSSLYLKITEHDIVSIFEQLVLELQPGIGYFEKQRAISALRHDAHAFTRDVQSEFRATAEKAQRIIMTHLKPYLPQEMRQSISECTERVCRDGLRFMLYHMLLRYNNGFNRHDVRYINAKLDMLHAQWSRDFPYASVSAYESWAFSLLQDLLFAECVVCMNHKADRYMSCCKSKSICRGCYSRVTSCPLCRAPKRPRR